LVRALVKRASNSANQDAQIGRTLFNLLVPVDLEPFMASSSATVLELDRGTAPIPWELLDSPVSGSADDRPWAIRTKLLRKLRTGADPRGVRDATADDSVLVIGDPACDREIYPVLYGARREANLVAACLSKPPTEVLVVPKVKTLISPEEGGEGGAEMSDISIAAISGSWRIIHIAGHGEPPEEKDGKIRPRGVVLSDQSFLGPNEIRALRPVPELVFINCCHLASTGTAALTATDYNRAAFASGVAEALIAAGVRCVIAAGWAVDDAAAAQFAQTFYTRLLAGFSFIEAVADAREVTRRMGGNTWAAYQCYGDQDWRYRPAAGDAQTATTPTLAQEFAGIGSGPALQLALQRMAVESEFRRPETNEEAERFAKKQVERLRYLETATARFWQGSGELAEAFGNAWAKAGRMPEAIAWYELARRMPDGTMSLAAVEQLANLKVREAWKNVSSNLKNAPARKKARSDIADAMRLLDTLLAVGPTIERESIYGSAYKRLAMVEDAEGDQEAEVRAIQQMQAHYGEAEKIALKALEADPAAPVNLFYPAMNRLAAEVAVGPAGGSQAAVGPNILEAIRQSMASVPPEFFSVVGQTELSVYASVLAGRLATEAEALAKEFTGHHERVSAPKMWGSVYDNAVFVLAKYRKRATSSDRVALDKLLSLLAVFAGDVPPAAAGNAPQGSSSRPAKKKRPAPSHPKAKKPRRK